MRYIIRGDEIVRTEVAGGKELFREPPADAPSVWLGVAAKDGHTTLDWWPTEEKAGETLRRNGLAGTYQPREFRIRTECSPDPIVFFGRFSGTLVPHEDGNTRFLAWKDATLAVPVHDLPAGMAIDFIELDVVDGKLYYFAPSGFLLATEKLTAG